MGKTLKQRLDDVLDELKRRNEVIRAQSGLIVRLRREVEELDTVNKRLEAEIQLLEKKLRALERGPK